MNLVNVSGGNVLSNLAYAGSCLRTFWLLFITVLSSVLSLSAAAQSSGNDQAHRQVLNQYCVTCHNQTLKTANVLLDVANIGNLADDPDLWERVLTKLTLRAMPPVGMPARPDEKQYESLVSYLRTGLGQLAAQNPNPGRPTIHRLNRAEYTNAIRDLLDLEINGSEYLPADNVEYGFDNIAEVLAVSPLLMEQYLFAAARVSRLAVGPANMLPVSESYTLPDELMQNSRTSDDLPFGTRGGLAIEHYFPMDGEYVIRVRLARNTAGYIRGMRKQHSVEVRLDRKRVELFKVGGEIHARSGPVFTDSQNPDHAGDLDQVGYELSADKDMEVRIPVTAGAHSLSAAFLANAAKKTGYLSPDLTLYDISNYKGGEPTILSVTITGPYNAKGAGETPSRNRIFTCKPSSAKDETCANSILSSLARRAYRRPVTENEVSGLLELYRRGRDQNGFEAGIELALQAILAGPEYLFRIEQRPPENSKDKIYQISELDLASRLSFFLWSSIPDEELLVLAENGKLREKGVLRQQVERMLADPRSEAFVERFGSQWLTWRDVEIVEPQRAIFTEFDGELRLAMKKELELWFKDMVREDKSVLDILSSEYTFINERLARHYKIPNIYGSNFRKVKLEDPLRRGILGKAGILSITSYNNRTSPVVRGKWVLENLLDMAPPPPPDDAFQPDLEVADKDTGRILTIRESMEKHRSNPICANCHKMMEPIGLALETFDATGAMRTRYKDADADVDASGILFDGKPFDDTLGFQKEFLKYADRSVETVTNKLFTYALGRGVDYYDKPAVREIVENAKKSNYTWSSLVLGIIESTPFQYRRL